MHLIFGERSTQYFLVDLFFFERTNFVESFIEVSIIIITHTCNFHASDVMFAHCVG